MLGFFQDATADGASAGVVLGAICTEFIGLAALATIAATVTDAHQGSRVSGYKAAFFVAIGFAVVAALNVAIHVRTRTHVR